MPPPDKIEFVVDLRFGEFLRFQVQWFLRRYWWLLFPVYLVGLGYPVYVGFMRTMHGTQTPLAVPGLLIPWGMLCWLAASLYFGSRKQYAAWWAGQTMRVTLDADGVASVMPSSATRVDWSKVKSMWVTGEFVLLVLSAQAVLIYPKRCIIGNATAADVVAFAAGRIGAGQRPGAAR